MFTLEWYIWLGICAVFIATLLILSLKLKWNKKTVIGVMCIISLLSELSKIFSHMREVNDEYGFVILRYCLPFHLCSILIFVYFYLFFGKNEELKEKLLSFTVPIGLFGGFLAMILATSGVDFTAPYAYQCFIYHAGCFYFSLYFIITKQVDLGKKALIRNCISLFVLAIIMIWVNGAFYDEGTHNVNFMFLVRPPMEGLPFLNLKHGYIPYFVHLCSLGLFLEFLVSLPYIIKEKKAGNDYAN